MILFFDTETTGMVDFNAPCSAVHQPDCVQLAALLCDNDGSELGSLNTLIKPNGWTISPEAQAVHGISLERCKATGISGRDALIEFIDMLLISELMVAHNIAFDLMIMDTMAYRTGIEIGYRKAKLSIGVEVEYPRKQFCTMRASTDVCKIPSRRGYKWPRLTEAHKILCGTEMQGAHDAMCDVRGCKAVFFALRKLGLA
jgi:DNA polymerase III subunit epsilon